MACPRAQVEGYQYATAANRMRLRMFNVLDDVKRDYAFAPIVTVPSGPLGRQRRVAALAAVLRLCVFGCNMHQGAKRVHAVYSGTVKPAVHKPAMLGHQSGATAPASGSSTAP